MPDNQKNIHFQVPTELFEEFHRLFPMKGQKKQFFTRLMSLAVDMGEQSDFAQLVWEEADRRSH